MDDVVKIVDMLSNETKHFSELYDTLEDEVKRLTDTVSGYEGFVTEKKGERKESVAERKALKEELSKLNGKKYQIAGQSNLDWAEFHYICTKLSVTEEDAKDLLNYEDLDDTQKAIFESEIKEYFDLKINSKIYEEIKAERDARNKRIKEIQNSIFDLDVKIEEIDRTRNDRLSVALKTAKDDKLETIKKVADEFKKNKAALDSISSYIENRVSSLRSVIDIKNIEIERNKDNDLFKDFVEEDKKEVERLNKYLKFYNDVIKDNLLVKYKKLFGNKDEKTTKITGEVIKDINDQMQIIFDVLANASKEDIDDLIEKVEKVANKIGKIEYTITLTPGETKFNYLNNKTGKSYEYDESRLPYLKDQVTLFKVNYEEAGVKHTKVVDFDGLMELYGMNIGKDMTNSPKQNGNNQPSNGDDQPSNGNDQPSNGNDQPSNGNDQPSNSNDKAVQGPAVVDNKMLTILRGRKTVLSDKSKVENVATIAVIGLGAAAQIGLITPLLATTPLGICVAIGGAAIYNRDKIKNMLRKTIEQVKVKSIERQLSKLVKEFNKGNKERIQPEIDVRYDLDNHMVEIRKNTTGDKNIDNWAPITAEDALALKNAKGETLKARVDEIFNTDIPSEKFFIVEKYNEAVRKYNEAIKQGQSAVKPDPKDFMEEIQRDIVRPEAITTAFQLYGGVMNHAEKYYDEYDAAALASDYAKAVASSANPVDINDASVSQGAPADSGNTGAAQPTDNDKDADSLDANQPADSNAAGAAAQPADADKDADSLDANQPADQSAAGATAQPADADKDADSLDANQPADQSPAGAADVQPADADKDADSLDANQPGDPNTAGTADAQPADADKDAKDDNKPDILDGVILPTSNLGDIDLNNNTNDQQSDSKTNDVLSPIAQIITKVSTFKNKLSAQLDSLAVTNAATQAPADAQASANVQTSADVQNDVPQPVSNGSDVAQAQTDAIDYDDELLLMLKPFHITDPSKIYDLDDDQYNYLYESIVQEYKDEPETISVLINKMEEYRGDKSVEIAYADEFVPGQGM